MSNPVFSYDVFLSHNQAQKDWTRNLARRLRDDGFKVWYDEWELPKLAGSNWIDALVQGVEQSRKVVLVWSTEFFTKTWPEFEATVIQHMDPTGRENRVIPLIHTPCDIPRKWGFRQALNFVSATEGSAEFEFRYHHLLHNLANTRPFEGDFERFKKQRGLSESAKDAENAAPKNTWQQISPEQLWPALEHIQETFDTYKWKCSWLTKNLCYSVLHPGEIDDATLAAYKESFVHYRVIIGYPAQREFDRLLRIATPPSIFKAYLDVFQNGLETEVSRLFNEILQIGLANVRMLNMRPVEWAKAHLNILITRNPQTIKSWIQSVCDKQDFSEGLKLEDFEDFLWWRDWRAPKLIYMQPSGNLPYHPESAWTPREDESQTQKLLDGLSQRFLDSLGFRLNDIAGKAEVELVKKGSSYTVSADNSSKSVERTAAITLVEATRDLEDAVRSFYELRTRTAAPRASRLVPLSEKQILEKIQAAMQVFTRDYDLPSELASVAKDEAANINIALLKDDGLLLSQQQTTMQIAATQIRDACQRIQNAAKPYLQPS